ncbi:MAG: DUF2550 family protein [Ornithinimicrobium sp.]
MDPTAMRLIVIVMVSFAVVAVVLVLAWFTFTRYFGRSREASRRAPCAIRCAEYPEWTLGTLSYEADRLVHRIQQGPRRQREHLWERSGLGVGIGHVFDGAEVGPRWRGSNVVAVPCTYGADSFELAISEGRYTALRAWVEAVPPGWNVNVA